MRFIRLGFGDRDDRAPRCSCVLGRSAKDVVVARLVGIPCDGNPSLGQQRSRWIPVIRWGCAYALFVPPCSAIPATSEHITLAIAETLPDQPHATLIIG